MTPRQTGSTPQAELVGAGQRSRQYQEGIPGDRLQPTLARAELHVIGHSARRALTAEIPPRATLTSSRLCLVNIHAAALMRSLGKYSRT
jgi:hypothetical protein